jgi:uncharacterized lipoprotein YmbA
MTDARPSRRALAAGLLALPVLAACGTTPSPRLFTLTTRPANAVGKFSKTISVKRVDLAKYLDRPQIVRYSDSYELSLSEFNRWGEGLADMITRVLVQSIAELLPGSQVYADSGAVTLSTADISLEVNIDRFEPDPTGAIVLQAQWIGLGKGQRNHLNSARISVTPSSSDSPAQVAAMSDALAELAKQIATGLAA